MRDGFRRLSKGSGGNGLRFFAANMVARVTWNVDHWIFGGASSGPWLLGADEIWGWSGGFLDSFGVVEW